MRILVVDDEPALRSSLERALALDAYDVRARRGRQRGARPPRRRRRSTRSCSTWRCRGIDGLEVCRRLRAAGDRTPVLMLTARDAIDDRVDGLDAGADDYLVKPFALRELQARLRALLRRVEEPAARRCASPTWCSTRARTRSGAASARSSSRAPSSRCCSCSSSTRARCSRRSQLFERVWGYDFGATSNALGVYIGYLRRKTEAGGEPRLLHTVRGVGYVLREAVMGLRGRLTLLAAGAVGDHRRARLGRLLPRRCAASCAAQVDDALGRQGGLVVARRRRRRSARRATASRSQVPAPPPRAGGSAPYVQMLDAAGKVERRVDAGPAGDPGRPRATRRWRRARRRRYEADRVIDGDHVRVSTVPTPGGGAFQLGRSLAGVDSTLSRLRWLLLALCAGRHRAGRRARAAVLAPGHPAGHRPHRGGRAHHRRPRTSARRVDARGERRGRADGGALQHDARHARGLARGSTTRSAAPARRRRLARAAHAGHQPAHEHRGAARRATTCRSRRGGGCSRTCATQTEELSALITDVIELARGDDAAVGHRGRAARRARAR